MEYIENSTDYQLHVTVESTNNSVSSPELVKDELKDQSKHIEPSRKSSRSMWPDTELVGVSIDDSNELSGKITDRKFKLSIDDYSTFDQCYEQLKKWLSGTKIDLPQKDSFKVTAFTFTSSEDGTVVTYDTTKTDEKDAILGYVYEYNGIKSNYSMIQGMVSFMFTDPDNGVSLNKFEDYVNSIVNHELVIIGNEEDIMKSEDQESNQT